MKKNNFKVLREGIHSTFQDLGYLNIQHLGISRSGVADENLFKIANEIVNNKSNVAVIEFSIQGPKLKLHKGKCRFVITGNVLFNIISKNKKIKGVPYRSYLLKKGDILDILTTIKSNFGYLAVEGGFIVSKHYGSSSTLTKSAIGPNNGKKISREQIIEFKKNGSNTESSLEINSIFFNKSNNIIRVLRGPQMHFFMPKMIKSFFSKTFKISNLSNRIGIRLEGYPIKSIKSHDIDSEGITKGSIQIPGNGEPIILMADHPSIGGYPKIATVIMADIAKLAQMQFGTNFIFKEVTLSEAENIYIESNNSFKAILNKIDHN